MSCFPSFRENQGRQRKICINRQQLSEVANAKWLKGIWKLVELTWLQSHYEKVLWALACSPCTSECCWVLWSSLNHQLAHWAARLAPKDLLTGTFIHLKVDIFVFSRCFWLCCHLSSPHSTVLTPVEQFFHFKCSQLRLCCYLSSLFCQKINWICHRIKLQHKQIPLQPFPLLILCCVFTRSSF